VLKPVAIAIASAALLGFTPSFTASGIGGPVQTSSFGKTKEGNQITRYTLANKAGMEASVINFGATLVSLKVPDRAGKLGDVVLGYDSVSDYADGKSFFGGSIGRYGNRIAAGQFTLDGHTYQIPKNDGPNTLHGGTIGFNKRVWTAADRSRPDAEVIEFSYLSPDGEEGYPGTLTAKVTYTLPVGKNELRIDYSASTDKDTVVNLTNHSYFNLTGDPTKDILKHELTLRAPEFTPVDATLIPTGTLTKVAGTPFDFTKSTAIGARIAQDDQQLKYGKGYDHNWVLESNPKGALRTAAIVVEPSTGRVLEVETTEPGIQFYSGNFLDGSVHGKSGIPYAYRTGFCLETQHFPDSPNHANFPSTELKPGTTLHSTTVLKFSTTK
jgi:aldose 1-epimerase